MSKQPNRWRLTSTSCLARVSTTTHSYSQALRRHVHAPEQHPQSSWQLSSVGFLRQKMPRPMAAKPKPTMSWLSKLGQRQPDPCPCRWRLGQGQPGRQYPSKGDHANDAQARAGQEHLAWRRLGRHPQWQGQEEASDQGAQQGWWRKSQQTKDQQKGRKERMRANKEKGGAPTMVAIAQRLANNQEGQREKKNWLDSMLESENPNPLIIS